MTYCKPIIFKDGGYSGVMPTYMTREAACADVALPYSVVIEPGEVVKVDLLLGFDIPNGYKITMYPRSSLLVKYGLMSPTSIIDSDYSGQHVHWPAINLSSKTVVLEAGTRVAQIELEEVEQCFSWDRLHDSRAGGFGSTGEGK